MANSYRDKDRWASKNGRIGYKMSSKGGKSYQDDDNDDDFDPRKALESLEEEAEEVKEEIKEKEIINDPIHVHKNESGIDIPKEILKDEQEILKPLDNLDNLDNLDKDAKKMQDDWNRVFSKKGKRQ